MPRFRLIKEAENTHDSEVTVTFDTDLLDIAQCHYNDFLKASGFEIPLDEYVIDKSYSIQKEEDWMWNEAIDFKFKNDGPVGSAGADIIRFPNSDS